jgi:hypothetical protein
MLVSHFYMYMVGFIGNVANYPSMNAPILLSAVLPLVLGKFGDAEGVASALSSTAGSLWGPTWNNRSWELDAPFREFTYLPAKLPGLSMEWQADVRKFQAEIRQSQSDCDGDRCGVSIVEMDGIGSALIRTFLEPQDMMAAKMRVVYVLVNNENGQQTWGWAEKVAPRSCTIAAQI